MASSKQPPLMRDDLLYAEWKKELDIWDDFTDLDNTRKGGALFLTLTGKAREAVLSGVPREKIKSNTGLAEIVKCLDDLYEKDKSQSAFAAYDDFTSFRRKHDTSIQEYIVEFNLKYNRIKLYNMSLPDGVLAYYLLKCANLPEEQSNICKATCSELTYKTMRTQIEKVTSSVDTAKSESVEVEPQYYGQGYEEEDYVYDLQDYGYDECYDNTTHDTYYAQQEQGRSHVPSKSSGGERRDGFSHNQWRGHASAPHPARQVYYGPPRPRPNPPDEFGNPSRCSFCRSIYHWVGRCPDAPRSPSGSTRRGSRRPGRGRGSSRRGHGSSDSFIWLEQDCSSEIADTLDIVLLTEPGDDRHDLMNETIGYMIIDSGCTQTVCGNTWLRTYIDTLSNREHRAVQSEQSKCNFRFGDGPTYTSTRVVIIPVMFGSHRAMLRTHVVDCEIPLLMSRQSLKRAHCKIDFVHDKVFMFGEEVPVKISRSGHYCVPLTNDDKQETIHNILFTSPINPDDDKANQKKVLKLHKQFAHPSSDRLKQLIWNSGVKDPVIDNIIYDVSQKCDVCKRFRRAPPRPVVSFPLATEFNETVAMDIKFINTRPVLHLIDHATRYSRACLLSNKKPMSVIQAVLTHWIQIFGTPVQFLTDNGGEFVNSQLLELSEKFNIVLRTTAAESAWSNGLCERHNGVIADMVEKIQDDSSCSLELAIPWAISAKNGLTNVYGFSPNQLVFGRNVKLPDVHSDKLPAQNRSHSSDLIARHLLALHKARQAFVAQESCEKLRRALNRQTRSYSDIVYHNGDNVYYKRGNNNEWHGPAKILGRDGSQYLLKHGGSYVRVHPCKLQLVDPLAMNDVCVQSIHSASNQRVPAAERTSTGVDIGTQYDGFVDEDYDSDEDVIRSCAPLSPPPTPQEGPHLNNVPIRRLSEVSSEGSEVDEEDHDYSQENHQSSPNVQEEEEDNLVPDDPHISVMPPNTDKCKIPRAVSRLADFNKPPREHPPEVEHQDACSSDDVVETVISQDLDEECDELTVVKSPRDLPKPSTKIRFRQNRDSEGEWCQGEVISRAGKSTTANWHFMNIKHQDEESARCVSLKGAQWEDIVPENEISEEEVYYGISTDGHRFDLPKEQEIKKWQEFGTFTEVEDIGQPRISTRWVCTEKLKGGKLVLKARLVARGFEEDKSQLRTDSPTCYKESLRLLLCILAANNWKLQSIDIKSAYLQGHIISRDIFLQPPECAQTKKLWKLNKTPYGLVDAGRQWYIRIVKVFTSLGAKQAKCDRAVFIWKDPASDSPCGVLVAHVDDFMFGGNSHFHTSILPQIRSTFQIGLEESSNMKYLGLSISQIHQGISLSLESYTNGLTEIDTSGCGVDRKRTLTHEEVSQFRHVVGQVNWVATQARPDVAFDNCVLGNSTSQTTVADLHRANKVIRKIRGQSVTLTFPSGLDLSTIHIVCFTDASFANLPDRGSQGGFIMFVVDDKGVYSTIAWQSKRIKRVVNSSLSAECLEAVEAAETCILLRARLEELLCIPSQSIKISLITDSKSLLDAVHTSTSVENKRLQIDINMLREMVERGEIDEFRWIQTEFQVANPLTKHGSILWLPFENFTASAEIST